MANLKFAVFGTGFWSQFQIPAWFEVGGVDLVALYNRTVSKAEVIAQRFNVPRVYGDPEELLKNEQLDFIDIITEVPFHAPLVYLAAKYKIPVICQKPMAPDYETAQKMVQVCRDANVPYMIHENFRWQTPMRALKQAVDSGQIGTPFRARIDFITGFPVFANQPFLKTLEHLIITDLGSHMLDIARWLFGEANSLYCQTKRVQPDIAGEDAATFILQMGGRTTVVANIAYAGSFVEREVFPQTLVFIEGDKGSIELAPDYWLRVTTKEGTFSRRVPPPRYAWADPAYDAPHASIVPCNANLLNAIKTGQPAETSGEDNLKTMRLVYSSYESAARNEVIKF
ncbi:MAG TPA: Gfo/Idh/MocA family oxidoreductase [Anaerolineae bacterium]|nr:Gfo/Idh/MocA family oxidoreductase [Anaerolineae bacterium]